MICKHCGKEMPEGSTFCMECGTRFEIVENENHSNVEDTKIPGQEQAQPAEGNEVQSNNVKTENGQVEKSNRKGDAEKTLKLPPLITVLLLVIGIGVAYLSIAQFRQSNTIADMDSSNRVLVVSVEMSEEESSDSTQIMNALSNGGMISININRDYIPSSIRNNIDDYAAVDSLGQYYTLGALLNYIASNGWTFVESTAIYGYYYFIR